MLGKGWEKHTELVRWFTKQIKPGTIAINVRIESVITSLKSACYWKNWACQEQKKQKHKSCAFVIQVVDEETGITQVEWYSILCKPND